MLFVNIQIKKQTKVNLLQEIIRISNYMGFLERPTTHLQWDIMSVQYRLLPFDYPLPLGGAIPTIYPHRFSIIAKCTCKSLGIMATNKACCHSDLGILVFCVSLYPNPLCFSGD